MSLLSREPNAIEERLETHTAITPPPWQSGFYTPPRSPTPLPTVTNDLLIARANGHVSALIWHNLSEACDHIPLLETLFLLWLLALAPASATARHSFCKCTAGLTPGAGNSAGRRDTKGNKTQSPPWRELPNRWRWVIETSLNGRHGAVYSDSQVCTSSTPRGAHLPPDFLQPSHLLSLLLFDYLISIGDLHMG